jgi:hypothetical protein
VIDLRRFVVLWCGCYGVPAPKRAWEQASVTMSLPATTLRLVCVDDSAGSRAPPVFPDFDPAAAVAPDRQQVTVVACGAAPVGTITLPDTSAPPAPARAQPAGRSTQWRE